MIVPCAITEAQLTYEQEVDANFNCPPASKQGAKIDFLLPRSAFAMRAMERLVTEGIEREGRETRQSLTGDGARLGRLTSSRVGGGGSGMMRSQTTTIETWEDGYKFDKYNNS
ncbi:hypothetical protein ACHAW5_004285 [Stephanodiscus triporus]|uniref:Uncharacterized protein n=1 Tax=Stephanodiscus triporus TaxID=2934178 RepID=A0ABD3MQ91_9STRA